MEIEIEFLTNKKDGEWMARAEIRNLNKSGNASLAPWRTIREGGSELTCQSQNYVRQEIDGFINKQ